MAWYKTGSVTINTGQTSVTGIGTKFVSNSRVGDGFRGPDGEWYEIVNTASETSIGIYPAYAGPSVVSDTSYMIAPLQGYNKESADRLRAITDSLTVVKSVAGRTGDVVLSKGDVGLINVDNTSDVNKPVSTATQTALNGKKDNFSQLPVAQGGTGATTADAARTNLVAARQGPNADITELNALTKTLTVAQGGTGVTTVAALLTNLLAVGAYGKTNIIGTVSQTSGVPTGAILERGTNSGGSYIKYADGTLHCWTRMSTTAVSNANGSVFNSAAIYPGSFPAAYISLPTVVATSTAVAFSWAGNYAEQTQSAWGGWVAFSPTATGGFAIINFFASGRWY